MTAPVFLKTLVHARHRRTFEIAPVLPEGWEVSQRDDERVVFQLRFTDWHRVERAVLRFGRDIAVLRSEGWIES